MYLAKSLDTLVKLFFRKFICTLREKCRSIAKQMLLMKFDCDDEIYIYLCEIYFIYCK